MFTTSAVDNIDHNPTAIIAQTSFHGTSVSILQHLNPEEPCVAQEQVKFSGDSKVMKGKESAWTSSNIQHIKNLLSY